MGTNNKTDPVGYTTMGPKIIQPTVIDTKVISQGGA
jgi:hypothetical protein